MMDKPTEKFKTYINNHFWQLFFFLILIIFIIFYDHYIIYVHFQGFIIRLLDLQIVALLIPVFVGVAIWSWQHRKKLRDKYYFDYLRSVFRFFAIKIEEADLRKGKNKLYQGQKHQVMSEKIQNSIKDHENKLSELNRQEIQNKGLIETNLFFLKKLKDSRYESVKEIYDDSEKRYKKFSKKNVEKTSTTKYEKKVNEISKYLKKQEKYILKTAE